MRDASQIPLLNDVRPVRLTQQESIANKRREKGNQCFVFMPFTTMRTDAHDKTTLPGEAAFPLACFLCPFRLSISDDNRPESRDERIRGSDRRGGGLAREPGAGSRSWLTRDGGVANASAVCGCRIWSTSEIGWHK